MLRDLLIRLFKKMKQVNSKTDAIDSTQHQDSEPEFKLFVPPGHFYSPVVDPSEIGAMPTYEPIEGDIGIDKEVMLKLLENICKHGQVFPQEKTLGKRYYSNNDQYAEGDAFTYTGILHQLKSKRIVEIGSGYSKAVVLDWMEGKGYDQKIDVTVIEPYPDRLHSLIFEDDNFTLIQKKVQEVDIDVFMTLQKNDVLFIDSSHVGKSGSDVLYELFKILPALKSGVWIHFHDCFWPFEYPEAWVKSDNRSWNELHFLRAFLTYNRAFEIKFFNHYLALNSDEWLKKMPTEVKNPGGALWIMKC